MTSNNSQKHQRIMSIAATTRGFGYAVLDGAETLADWGVKRVEGKDKNNRSLTLAKKLIAQYQPEVIVLPDASSKVFRRAPRIQALTKRIVALAARNKVRVKLFTVTQVRQAFFVNGQGTKQALAEVLVKRFSEELTQHLPPRRRPWMSEDSRMGIFDAVALVVAFRHTANKTAI